ncbi:MAG TPA: hypothetical protein VGQ09_02495 [Chitinophagaceae bacterium]|jgi:hypothetical protein|nr:hypothetical protein [Chitinophagaceae bacterium]
MNIKPEFEYLESRIETSRWNDHEHVRGYGVCGLLLSGLPQTHVFT